MAKPDLPSHDIDARIDKLTQALFHLTGELWAMRDRQSVLERVLADAGIDAPAMVDSYRPDAAFAEVLASDREALVTAMVRILAPDA